ncbi:hypothetical protein LY76DRAFT_164699 [Colletotrichum caudatum]|nr:hypothetical protein LY76DRAFT_164699 [Colletotrichum caudatum]
MKRWLPAFFLFGGWFNASEVVSSVGCELWGRVHVYSVTASCDGSAVVRKSDAEWVPIEVRCVSQQIGRKPDAKKKKKKNDNNKKGELLDQLETNGRFLLALKTLRNAMQDKDWYVDWLAG